MQKRSVRLLTGLGLAVGMLLCGLAGFSVVEQVGSRYPGSLVAGEQNVEVMPDRRPAIDRRSDFTTAEALPAVRAWYARRFQVSPAADNVAAGGECVYLSQYRQYPRVRYSATVLLCGVTRGTRISLNESLSLWP